MKHGNKIRKFGRKRDQRKALLKIMAFHLIMKEKIKTTEAKAKELRPFIEKLITKAKKANQDAEKRLSFIRQLSKFLPEEARKKIVKAIGPQYKDRNGGYTRITKAGMREKDGAKMAFIELVKPRG